MEGDQGCLGAYAFVEGLRDQGVVAVLVGEGVVELLEFFEVQFVDLVDVLYGDGVLALVFVAQGVGDT